MATKPRANQIKFTTSGGGLTDIQTAFGGTNGAENIGWVQDGSPITGDLATRKTKDVATKLTEFVSVRDFGALGDGETDDTEAINNALDVAKGKNKIVALPATFAYYKTTSRIILHSNTGIVGIGGRPVIRLEGLTTDSAIEFSNAENWVIENLEIDGDKATKTASSSAMRINSSSKGYIHNVRIKDCRAWGIILQECVDISGHDIEVNGCQTSSAIFFNNSSYCRFNTIRARRNGGFGVQVFSGSNNNSIIDLISEDNQLEGIGVKSDCYENHFDNIKVLNSHDTGLSINGSRNTVSNFIIDGADFHGITLHGSQNTVSNGIVKNIGKATTSGIFSLSGILIAPNFGGRGSYNHVSNVLVYDDQAIPTTVTAFRCWGDSHANWVSGNTISTGEFRRNAGNVYICTTAGITASPGPTHTSGTVLDGGGVGWQWVMVQDEARKNTLINCQGINTTDVELAFGSTTTNTFISRKLRASEGIEFQSQARFDGDVSFGTSSRLVSPSISSPSILTDLTFPNLIPLRRTSPAWSSGSNYIYGDVRSNAGRTYVCISVGGTATIAPTHSSGIVTGADGITWNMLVNATGSAIIRTLTNGICIQGLVLQNPTQAEGAGTINDYVGVGTPEGKVTAPVGSLYRRADGGAGSTLYIKESGTGTTGWVAK